jgi:hypothetical protein
MSEQAAGHVQQSLLEPGQETGYVRIFWQVGLECVFQRFALHQLTRCIPLDSPELLGHK